MEKEKQFLLDTFTEIIEQINIKLDETKNIESLFNKYKDILKKLDEIFVKEKETNRQNLEPDDFDFLRGIVFMKGSHEFHEKINGVMGYYILNYRTQPEFRKYTNFELIESDIKNIIQTEIDLLYKQIEGKNILNEYKDLLEKLVSAVNGNKYISVETAKLFEIIGNFKEVNNEYKTNILMSLIDYNNDVVKNSEIKLEKQEEKVIPEVVIEPVQNEVVEEPIVEENMELVISDTKEEKKKVKSVRNVKKKDIQEEKEIVTENIEEKQKEEEIEFLDEDEIILSSQAKAIYDTIYSMISTMSMEDVLNYVKETSIWGNSYLEEIKLYCNKKHKNNTDKVILEIFNAISIKQHDEETLGDGIIIFKGYDETTSLVEKDLRSLKDDYHLESVKIYLEQLKNKDIDLGEEAFHSNKHLTGSYHKKNRKAVRLCYEILGNGIYYIYDLSIKKSDNDKGWEDTITSRRPGIQEKKYIKALLENEKTRRDLIEKNQIIYDNIISYIEEEVPELKDTGISR